MVSAISVTLVNEVEIAKGAVFIARIGNVIGDCYVPQDRHFKDQLVSKQAYKDITNEYLSDENTLQLILNYNTFEAKIYPNPCSNQVSIQLNKEVGNSATFSVYNIFGTLITTGELIYANTEINTSRWARGVYIVNLEIGGSTYPQKIIKL